MRIADLYKGKSVREIASLIADTTVAELIEVTSQSEISTKIEEIRKAISKSSPRGYLVVVFKE